jgi:hypothetical protein
MRHTWERRENFTSFWWESLKERDHLEDRGTDRRMGSKWTLGRLAGRVWSGFIWLSIGNDRRLVNTVINLRVLAPQSWLVKPVTSFGNNSNNVTSILFQLTHTPLPSFGNSSNYVGYILLKIMHKKGKVVPLRAMEALWVT